MKKRFLSALLLCSGTSMAEQVTYQSIANVLKLSDNGKVAIKLLIREDEGEITCSTGEYDFEFDLSSIVGQKWYDTLILSRTANSLIDFQYDDSSCTLSAITLPKLYRAGNDVGNETPDGKLAETGEHGNVALIKSNGLTDASYQSSSFYGQDSHVGAFDGYLYKEKINEDADTKLGRGIWMTKRIDSDNKVVTPWIQVDFGKEVTLSGMRTMINKKSMALGRSPRNIVLLTSEDGKDFTQFESYRLGLREVVDTSFSSAVTSRFIRMQIDSNYGDNNFIEIDEWELSQD